MRSKRLILMAAIGLLVISAFLILARRDAALAAQDSSSKVENLLQDELNTNGSADFIVQFSEQADLSAAYSMDWDARGEYVYNALRETAERSQAQAKVILDAAGLSYQTFINGNQLYVRGGTYTNAIELADLPEISQIDATRTYSLDPYMVSPIAGVTWAGDLLSRRALATVNASTQAAVDWGISDTKADQFWNVFGVRGAGIVVASIDTGVQWNHPALDQAYKCSSNPSDPKCWYDPTGICGAIPCDNTGHGTHTMGTMVADDDPSLPYIAGMAPDAKWIACKGCESTSCSSLYLNSCADWILAPGGSPANRPNIVNNSWGGDGGENWYQAKVQAWVAAGIFPAFSAGNNTGCPVPGVIGSMGSPGDYQESFASTGHNNTREHFFAQGPSAFGDTPYTKPNISAPGVNICSSVPTNSWSCGYSGTSMASPHTAGAVALLWSCSPSLVGNVDATFQALQSSADPAPAGNCGAPPSGEGNYTYGYGYLDVLKAGQNYCGAQLGALDGFVRDQDGHAIQAALVQADTGIQGGLVQASTDPSGYYTMTLPVGSYEVTASKNNYTSQTIRGIEIHAHSVTTQNFTLTSLGSWTQIALPPSCPNLTRFDGEYYPADGLVYFLGGRGGTDGAQTYGDIYSFNPATHTCADTGEDMPTPISNYTVSFVHNHTGDALCTFGGRAASGVQTSDVQCYYPGSNTASVVTHMPSAWDGYGPYTQVVVDNMVYIFGGFNNTSQPYMLARTDRYDPLANSFTQMGDLSLARSYIMAAAVDGKIYAFGGDTFDGSNLIAMTRAEVFDPAAQRWNDSAVTDLPSASGEGRAFGFDRSSGYFLAGQVILAAGGQWPGDTNQVITYDVASNSYRGFIDLNVSRRDQASFFIPGDPGSMWVFGGHSGVDTPPYADPEYYQVFLAKYAFLPVALK
jgi:subtilisin family serine protease